MRTTPEVRSTPMITLYLVGEAPGRSRTWSAVSPVCTGPVLGAGHHEAEARPGPGAGQRRAWGLRPSRPPFAPGVPAARVPRPLGRAEDLRRARFCDLIITAHRQLDAPLAWCRDNLSRHLAEEPADFAEANRAWLRVFQVLAHTPVLNPEDGVWSLLRQAVANCVVAGLPALVGLLRHKLKGIHIARICSTAVSPVWMCPGSAAAAPVWSGSTTMRPWSVRSRGGRQEGELVPRPPKKIEYELASPQPTRRRDGATSSRRSATL